MTDLERLLVDLAAVFGSAEISYAVMGGIAVRVYGIPRATYDIDFTIAIDQQQIPGVFESVERIGGTVPEPYRRGWVDRVGDLPVIKLRFYLEAHGIDVDLFLAETAFQRALLARRRWEKIDGATVSVVSPEDLILLKLLAGRPRDFADVADVLFIQGTLDEAYLRQWAAELDIVDRLESALSG